jgi:hypothetical protein
MPASSDCVPRIHGGVPFIRSALGRSDGGSSLSSAKAAVDRAEIVMQDAQRADALVAGLPPPMVQDRQRVPDAVEGPLYRRRGRIPGLGAPSLLLRGGIVSASARWTARRRSPSGWRSLSIIVMRAARR